MAAKKKIPPRIVRIPAYFAVPAISRTAAHTSTISAATRHTVPAIQASVEVALDPFSIPPLTYRRVAVDKDQAISQSTCLVPEERPLDPGCKVIPDTVDIERDYEEQALAGNLQSKTCHGTGKKKGLLFPRAVICRCSRQLQAGTSSPLMDGIPRQYIRGRRQCRE